MLDLENSNLRDKEHDSDVEYAKYVAEKESDYNKCSHDSDKNVGESFNRDYDRKLF